MKKINKVKEGIYSISFIDENGNVKQTLDFQLKYKVFRNKERAQWTKEVSPIQQMEKVFDDGELYTKALTFLLSPVEENAKDYDFLEATPADTDQVLVDFFSQLTQKKSE